MIDLIINTIVKRLENTDLWIDQFIEYAMIHRNIPNFNLMYCNILFLPQVADYYKNNYGNLETDLTSFLNLNLR